MGLKASETFQMPAYVIIHYLEMAQNTVIHKEVLSQGSLLSPSHKCLMPISKFFSKFPMKKPVGFDGAWKVVLSFLPSSKIPQVLTPVADTSWLKVPLGLTGPTLVSKASLSPVSGCWFYLSSVS